MSLKYKVIFMVIAVFTLSGSLDYGIQRLVIMPSYITLEREEAEKNMQRVVEAINRELQLLDPLVADWAYWDDTRRFTEDHNSEFLASNLGGNSLANLKVNLLNIYDGKYDLILGRAQQLNSSELLQLGELSAPRLPEGHPLLNFAELEGSVSGIVGTSHAPLLIVARQILTSEHQGPTRGILTMGRFLDEAALRRIADQVRLRVTTTSPTADASPATWIHPSANAIPHTPIELDDTQDSLRSYTTLGDLFGRPLLTLRVDTPRAITHQGEQAVHVALLSIGGTALLVMSMLLVMLHRTVLNPIGKLTAHAIQVGAEGDLRGRIALKRNDELGTLARELDRMTERLAEARHRLIDQSYQDGIAEMARGVLHNIGNAITPLGVRLAILDEDLRMAPAAAMERAVAELADAQTPPERRIDLARFVELAGGALASLVTRGQEQLAAITQQVGHIQHILADQERYSRAARVLEPVNLEQAIQEATQLLAPPMREAMITVLDSSVRQVGEVMTSRAALQQVLGNLLVNAAESIMENGSCAGRLRVRALRELSDGQPMAHLYFEDNGGGIAKENLTRLFESGFSTKSRGSGLGLHWSANTVTALRGHIYAESAGLGAGACMHLLLPLVGQYASATTIAMET